MKLLILISAITLISACSTATIPVPVVLQVPPELLLPKIPGTEMQCLPDQIYKALVIRDRMQTERRQTLRDIIESTHK